MQVPATVTDPTYQIYYDANPSNTDPEKTYYLVYQAIDSDNAYSVENATLTIIVSADNRPVPAKPLNIGIVIGAAIGGVVLAIIGCLFIYWR